MNNETILIYEDEFSLNLCNMDPLDIEGETLLPVFDDSITHCDIELNKRVI